MKADRINELFMTCLFKPDELVDGKPIGEFHVVEGITQKFGLHPERLAATKEELKEMIDELPLGFTEGGGWSFLELCMDKNGEQWTGFQKTTQEFLVMCIGNGLARYLMPRELWQVAPGGVPYVEFSKDGFSDSSKVSGSPVVVQDSVLVGDGGVHEQPIQQT